MTEPADMLPAQIRPDIIIRGSIFPEPVKVLLTVPMGTSVKLICKRLKSGMAYDPVLAAGQLAS